MVRYGTTFNQSESTHLSKCTYLSNYNKAGYSIDVKKIKIKKKKTHATTLRVITFVVRDKTKPPLTG